MIALRSAREIESQALTKRERSGSGVCRGVRCDRCADRIGFYIGVPRNRCFPRVFLG